MNKLIVSILFILFSSCIGKKYVEIKNSTNSVLYYGVSNILTSLEQDTQELLLIIHGKLPYGQLEKDDHTRKWRTRSSLQISLRGDTISLSNEEYLNILDSLWAEPNSFSKTLDITESWFYQQKEMLRRSSHK